MATTLEDFYISLSTRLKEQSLETSTYSIHMGFVYGTCERFETLYLSQKDATHLATATCQLAGEDEKVATTLEDFYISLSTRLKEQSLETSTYSIHTGFVYGTCERFETLYLSRVYVRTIEVLQGSSPFSSSTYLLFVSHKE